jgi:hypothetical protein
LTPRCIDPTVIGDKYRHGQAQPHLLIGSSRT